VEPTLASEEPKSGPVLALGRYCPFLMTAGGSFSGGKMEDDDGRQADESWDDEMLENRL
jgi:hypothetical protein